MSNSRPVKDASSGPGRLRTPSSGSSGSEKSKISHVSDENIHSNRWAATFIKYASGAPLGEPMSRLKTTKARASDHQGNSNNNSSSSGSSRNNHKNKNKNNGTSSHTKYAWVRPKCEDSVSKKASKPESRRRSSGRRGKRSNDEDDLSLFAGSPPTRARYQCETTSSSMSSGTSVRGEDVDDDFSGTRSGSRPPAPLPVLCCPTPPPADVAHEVSTDGHSSNDGGGGGGGGNDPETYDDWE